MADVTGGVATGAALDAGRQLMSSMTQADPAWLDKADLETILKGKTSQEQRVIVNFLQKLGTAVEQATEQYKAQFGIKVDGNLIDRFNDILQANSTIGQEQSRKAMEAWSTLMGDFNRGFVESEKLKLASKIGPYEMAGKFAGFVYGIGAIIEAVSPGSGRNLMNTAGNVIAEVNGKISSLHIDPVDAAKMNESYSKVALGIVAKDLFKHTDFLKELGASTGNKVDGNGSFSRMNGWRDTSEQNGTNPQSPVKVQREVVKGENGFAASAPAGKASASDYASAGAGPANASAGNLDAMVKSIMQAKVPEAAANSIGRSAILADGNKDGKFTSDEAGAVRDTKAYKGLTVHEQGLVDKALGLPEKGLFSRALDAVKGWTEPAPSP